jgi:hypothetical protein
MKGSAASSIMPRLEEGMKARSLKPGIFLLCSKWTLSLCGDTETRQRAGGGGVAATTAATVSNSGLNYVRATVPSGGRHRTNDR